MPSCFVPDCTISSHHIKEGVTFHSFPKALQQEWLKAIGRDENTFVIYERVCSEHFKTDDFEKYGVYKRLKPGVVPSLKLHMNQENRTEPHKQSSCESENTEQKQIQPYIDEPSCSFATPYNMLQYSSSSAKKMVQFFHSYSLNPTEAPTVREKEAEKKITHLTNKLKNVERTSIRRKEKIQSLKQIINDLKQKFSSSHSACTTLEHSFDIVVTDDCESED